MIKIRKKFLGFTVILLYCFPYAYFSMYQDFTNNSMVGYLVMISATVLISFLGSFFINPLSFIIGNMVSAVVSFYLINRLGADWGHGYFKPFSPTQLLGVVSVLILIPQFLAAALAHGFKLIAIELSNKFKNRTKN